MASVDQPLPAYLTPEHAVKSLGPLPAASVEVVPREEAVGGEGDVGMARFDLVDGGERKLDETSQPLGSGQVNMVVTSGPCRVEHLERPRR